MDMYRIHSSHLAQAGYDPFSELLRIEFTDGLVYDYRGVPEHIFRGLMASDSAGEYHYRRIRDVYPYTKIS